MATHATEQPKKPPFLRIDCAFRDHLKDLKGPVLPVLLCISLYTNGNKESHPSISRIVEQTGLSRVAVWKAIRQLESAGWLSVERNRSRSNHYRLATSLLGNDVTQVGNNVTHPLGNDVTPKKIQLEEETRKKRDPETDFTISKIRPEPQQPSDRYWLHPG